MLGIYSMLEGKTKIMKKNKPRWKNLDMWERLARRCKQNGASEDTVEHIRDHGKQREIGKISK
nr:MAG TPA: hypothetical protein [Bacteriophage sp.]